VLQHVPFEGLGSIGGWLEERGARIGWTRLFADDPLPPLDGLDLVIALGGPMSVNDEARLPWLAVEQRVLREAIARGIPVLGVCLGAQLIASALGARVRRAAVPEIGWFPIEAVAGPDGTFRFPAACTVFHWHGETFDLPEGAVRLARSAACDNQAFQLARHVIGLQFHPEMTPAGAHALAAHCRDELVPGPTVHSEQELRAAPAARYHAANALMDAVLDYLLAPRAAPVVRAGGSS
jgi:GMP synthase-like glutamine amidotransferase